MDKNAKYKDPSETWGKNKISMTMWDFLEEGTAVLTKAAEASQFLEGDKYPTSSLVIPMAFALMVSSSPIEQLKFRNRAEDELNDDSLNPVKVPNDALSNKMQTARKLFHESLITRFDSDVPRSVKQFWFISALCDPRFKKLVFKHDRLLTDLMWSRALLWFKAEFDKNFKGKVAAAPQQWAAPSDGSHPPHLKRRKTSASGFFAESDSEESEAEEAQGPYD